MPVRAAVSAWESMYLVGCGTVEQDDCASFEPEADSGKEDGKRRRLEMALAFSPGAYAVRGRSVTPSSRPRCWPQGKRSPASVPPTRPCPVSIRTQTMSARLSSAIQAGSQSRRRKSDARGKQGSICFESPFARAPPEPPSVGGALPLWPFTLKGDGGRRRAQGGHQVPRPQSTRARSESNCEKEKEREHSESA